MGYKLLIRTRETRFTSFVWIPACAGMTVFSQTCRRTDTSLKLPPFETPVEQQERQEKTLKDRRQITEVPPILQRAAAKMLTTPAVILDIR